MAKPVVAITMGDPAGIGPEVVAKSLDGGVRPGQGYIPVVIGSPSVIEKTFHDLSSKTKVRKISDISEAQGMDITAKNVVLALEANNLKAGDFPMGLPSRAAGEDAMKASNKAAELVMAGKVQATVGGPGNTDSRRMASDSEAARISALRQKEMGFGEDTTCLVLISDKLRVAHLCHFDSLTESIAYATKDNVLAKLKLTDVFLKSLGLPKGRIALAGINAHCRGAQDERELKPAVSAAQELGINVEGPHSPDTIFYRCAEGEFDAVLALYHDQGHIAVKTYGFKRGVVVTSVGLPYASFSVGHGSAYDIAGKGVANPGAMSQAIEMAGQMVTNRIAVK